MKVPKHVIIQRPELQAQLISYDNGPYATVKMPNTPEDYYYIVGEDGINCISMPMDQMRTIWSKSTADIIASELNQKFPTESAPDVEKVVDTIPDQT